ncbi:MAG: DUF418 domain-containing protein, partial [Cytophagales bacterium]|nr:DUF418 domain-containing protein [Cytophagales bacterium]
TLELFALFIAGMLLGRKRIFERIDEYRQSFAVTFGLGFTLFAFFHFLGMLVNTGSLTSWQKQQLETLLTSYSNLAITAMIISLTLLVYAKHSKAYIFQWLASYGKMSLTNYVFQAVFGVILFYEFGFGLYKYLGSAWSLALGFFVFATQVMISHYWSKKFYYGPMEWVWRSTTYFDFTIKFRRQSLGSEMAPKWRMKS